MSEERGSRRDGGRSPRSAPFDHDTFISPLTWRYGSTEMRQIWSESHKRKLMRRMWLALARAQYRAGLVAAEQVADLERHVDDVDVARALEIERETRHDVMAEIQAYAEQCPVGGGIIHWGATSADITDNADVLRIREAVQLLERRLQELLAEMLAKIRDSASLTVMAYTHMQPAEPTTLGYRFAVYAQDLGYDLRALRELREGLRGKGLKGATGTQASFQELLRGVDYTPGDLEADVMSQIGLPAFPIATQTYSRRQDLRVMQGLAGIAATLHKFALDFRFLQSPAVGEWSEPFAENQVGSSAMPFKRNPINMENVCSLARYVATLPGVAWDNAAQTVLERTLDDSANRRLYLPQGFLITDEMLGRARRVLAGMSLDEGAVARNMATYGPFAATERVLMALVSAGADRQEGHEWIRQATMKAWEALRSGADTNPLAELLGHDERILAYLSPSQIQELMDAAGYVGTAPERALALAETIEKAIN